MLPRTGVVDREEGAPRVWPHIIFLNWRRFLSEAIFLKLMADEKYDQDFFLPSRRRASTPERMAARPHKGVRVTFAGINSSKRRGTKSISRVSNSATCEFYGCKWRGVERGRPRSLSHAAPRFIGANFGALAATFAVRIWCWPPSAARHSVVGASLKAGLRWRGR
jgi:hypothetical protein